MAFTASTTQFGHVFANAVVEITEANLEYRLNSFGAGPDGDTPQPTTRLRIGYSVYVDQAAKDAGADTDIVDGDIITLAEAIIKAKIETPSE